MHIKKDCFAPACEINPASYRRLPRLEELRSGNTCGSRLFGEVLEIWDSGYLSQVSDNTLCEEILRYLHADMEEFPGISMACYWLWDRALTQQKAGEVVNPSLTDIYGMLCAMQRNRFRLVLQRFFEKEEEMWNKLMEKACFCPENFLVSRQGWESLKRADEVLGRARRLVLDRVTE